MTNETLGLSYQLSQTIEDIERRKPGCLPDLSADSTLLVVSDYGGEHRESRFLGVSVLVVGGQSWFAWERERLDVRRRMKLGTRRFAFKKLSDRLKINSLPRFLDAADNLEGIIVTVLLDKAIDSLFEDEVIAGIQGAELYPAFTPQSILRTLRIVHVVSLFVSGLSAPGQNVLWITDEDEIAANEERLTSLTQIFAHISSHYLNCDLGHLRCATTNSDLGDLNLEDLAAIPDLTAGAMAELMTAYRSEGRPYPVGLMRPVPKSVSRKSKLILNWLAFADLPLRRLILSLEAEPDSTALTVRTIKAEALVLEI